jgi:hypothetical protein
MSPPVNRAEKFFTRRNVFVMARLLDHFSVLLPDMNNADYIWCDLLEIEAEPHIP